MHLFRKSVQILLIPLIFIVVFSSSILAIPAFPGDEDSIAVLGCSNTGQHAEGYERVSTEGLLADVTRKDIGGQALLQWAGASPKGWNVVAEHEPIDGYSLAWFQICLRSIEHNGYMDSTHQSQVQTVIERLESEYGLSPSQIYISPLNFYEETAPCTGEQGPVVAADIADWATANLGVQRGPDTGPMSKDMLLKDNCHLATSGEDFVGQQLAAFFDGSGDLLPLPEPTTDSKSESEQIIEGAKDSIIKADAQGSDTESAKVILRQASNKLRENNYVEAKNLAEKALSELGAPVSGITAGTAQTSVEEEVTESLLLAILFGIILVIILLLVLILLMLKPRRNSKVKINLRRN